MSLDNSTATRDCIAECRQTLGGFCAISNVTAHQFTLRSLWGDDIKVVFVMRDKKSGYAYYAAGAEPVRACEFKSLREINFIITLIFFPETIRRTFSSAS